MVDLTSLNKEITKDLNCGHSSEVKLGLKWDKTLRKKIIKNFIVTNPFWPRIQKIHPIHRLYLDVIHFVYAVQDVAIRSRPGERDDYK